MTSIYSRSSQLTRTTQQQSVATSMFGQANMLTKRDEMLYFEEPRYTCAEIAPEILRAKTECENHELQQKFSVMRKLLENAGAQNIDKTMKHLHDFDRSEQMKLVGTCSNNTYNAILESRGFDMYGRLRTQAVTDEQKQFRREEGVDLEEDVEVPQIFKEEDKNLKKLPLITPKWKIGEMEKYNAPVGFAMNPNVEYRSFGNEVYYSYDGEWESGKMNGQGSYTYSDGRRFVGYFKENRPDGKGTAQYGEGFYEGSWSQGKYSGDGKTTGAAGANYKGQFLNGRRDGEGRIDYGVGLYYEGKYADGKPHGRGRMSSELTGFSFEGTFHRGRACGSGVLTTPPPNSARIVRLWGEEEGTHNTAHNTPTKESKFDMDDDTISEHGSDFAGRREKEQEKQRIAEEKMMNERTDSTADGFLLPGIVKAYLAELQEEKDKERKREEETYGPLQTLKLNEYVERSRDKLHNERAMKKREIIVQKLKRQADLRQEIKDARLKAVESLLEEERQRRNVIGNVLKSVGFSTKGLDGNFLDDEDDVDDEHTNPDLYSSAGTSRRESQSYAGDSRPSSMPNSRPGSKPGSAPGSAPGSRRYSGVSSKP